MLVTRQPDPPPNLKGTFPVRISRSTRIAALLAFAVAAIVGVAMFTTRPAEAGDHAKVCRYQCPPPPCDCTPGTLVTIPSTTTTTSTTTPEPEPTTTTTEAPPVTVTVPVPGPTITVPVPGPVVVIEREAPPVAVRATPTFTG